MTSITGIIKTVFIVLFQNKFQNIIHVLRRSGSLSTTNLIGAIENININSYAVIALEGANVIFKHHYLNSNMCFRYFFSRFCFCIQANISV